MDLISGYKPHPNVIIGDDDELFLSGGAHHVEDFILGIKKPNSRSFENFTSNLNFRKNISKDIGAKYIHIIFTDKQTVYADKYPIKNTKSLGNLYKKSCDIEFLYPVKELESADSYFKTDSHWNPFGALVATKVVLDDFKIVYHNEKKSCHLATKQNNWVI